MSDGAFTKPRCKTIRLAEYDYSLPGAYFVTICTHRNQYLFGIVGNGIMEKSPAGNMVADWWQKIPEKFPNISLDSYMVMPNHLHGIVNILEPDKTAAHVGADPCVRPAFALPEVVKWFKTITTNEYIRGVKQGKWPQFDKHLWQRSYYEHVIRKLEDINNVREYILKNPLRWELKKRA